MTAKGTLWSWDEGKYGRLGLGDCGLRQRPVRLGMKMHGGLPVVMVACGDAHTLVVTAIGLVYSCGCGRYGKLGHGDEANKNGLTLAGAERFMVVQISIVAAGGEHSVALGAEGREWTWGNNGYGQLGLNDNIGRLEPTLPAGKTLCGGAAVLVAAGMFHTVAVMIDGALWAWVCGTSGQLGLGDCTSRPAPQCVGGEEAFGGSQILTVGVGHHHTMAVTKKGTLCSMGTGAYGALDHKDDCHGGGYRMPTLVDALHIGNGRIVS